MDKYERPSKKEIKEESLRRGILQHIETDSDATINLHKRVMALESANKIESPETPLVNQHETEISERADLLEKQQDEKDAAEERAKNSPAKKQKRF